MAKLHSYYTLCPLIDQQNLLGVEKDSASGCAIVTLGRNIVIRYKLQDPKQLSSWSTRDRLTTQVIYDETTCKYVGIFNEKKIRVWSEEESDLSSVKEYRFHKALHTILTLEGFPPVLVSRTAATASLEWALQNRKTWSDPGILNLQDKILDCRLIRTNDRISLYLLTQTEGTYTCMVVKLNEESSIGESRRIRRIELKRRSETLVGHTVVQSKHNAYLLTLWSHGRLYCHSLTESSTESNSKSNALIGVIGNINTEHPVVMTPLNDATIAFYGADVSEEGAILMIYNVQFRLVQAVQKLKLYTREAKLWKIEDKLLLAANRHLAIAPYHVAAQRIATLLGSSARYPLVNDQRAEDDDDVVVIQESTIAEWEKNQSQSVRLSVKPPKKLSKQISSYVNEGFSDATIQDLLVPQLIEAKDVSSIVWCLDTLKDLSDKLLIDLLAFSLRTSDETFRSLQNGAIDNDLANNDFCSRNNFLDKIFSVAYSDVSLSSYLKMGLNFDEVLRLLRYIIQKLDDQERSFDNIAQQPTDKQLYEWSNRLLDSHHQQFILSQDTDVPILFEKLKTLLEDDLQFFKDLGNLRPILNRTINGKSSKLSPTDRNKFYAIEEIKLY